MGDLGIGKALLLIKPGLDIYVDCFVEHGYLKVARVLQDFPTPWLLQKWLVTELALAPNDADCISKGLFRSFAHSLLDISSEPVLGPSEQLFTAARPLLDPAMGTENMGTLLYSLVRFCKPHHILEVGAGYTSVYLCQALKDNVEELRRGVYMPRSFGSIVPWNTDQVEKTLERDACGQHSRVYCVDNLAHEHTTAHLVQRVVEELDMHRHMHVINDNVWKEGFADMFAGDSLDLIWADFGVAVKLDVFWDMFWPKLNSQGGMLIIHSSLTNSLTRQWIDQKRADMYANGAEYEMMSFLEPHKQLQNSCTILRKRAKGYSEPIYSTFP